MKLLLPRFFSVLIILSFPVIVFDAGITSAQLKLIPFEEGVPIGNNMPELAWEPIACEKYEIWIDGLKMDELESSHTCYTAFPLSFGKHSWQVVAVQGDQRIESNTSGFVIDDRPVTSMPDNALLLRYHWKMRSSALVSKDGSELSGPGAGTDKWLPTSLPASVLTVLVRNAVYPNPYTGINNMLIPDCSDEFNQEYDLMKYSHIPDQNPWKEPYWYVTEFMLPGSFSEKLVWLNFGEINYRAEVWLNGKMVTDTSHMVGMEKLFRFELSSLLSSEDKNYLAVAIYPPDHPGKPSPPPLAPLAHPGRNLGGDAMLTRDYTKWDAMGWDWQPAIRDRDMGIVEDVFLTATDALELADIYITSDLPLPDTTSADLSISALIINYSENEERGIIQASISIDDDIISFERPFHLLPGESWSFHMDKDNIPGLHIENPALWWPLGYGAPRLYTLKLSAVAARGDVSEKEIRFGIREAETYMGNNERVYKINGQDIYCKGGNWVLDMMLNWTASRYRNEILLTRNANLNMLRVWGPTGAPPDVFFDAADANGIMLWQDFLFDFWGTFRATAGYTPDDEVYRNNTISVIKKYRNHPSLVIWCGGNEGVNPREEIIMTQWLAEFDGRDSRHYLKNSAGDGLHGGGPYHTIPPEEYFSHRNLTGFSSELGPSGMPVYRSMKKFLPLLGKDYMEDRFPVSGEWTYHDATNRTGSDNRKFTHYDDIIRNRYGAPQTKDTEGVIDYMDKCQLLNYDVYRACIESINRNLWTASSGFALWKSNSSWPSLTWQVYDWYMQSHAGYFGTQKASESFHIQLNRDDMSVVMVNAQLKEITDVTIQAVLYDSQLNVIWSEQEEKNIPVNAVTPAGIVVPSRDQLCFLRLEAQSADGSYRSDNFYWLHQSNDYTQLSDLAFSGCEGSATVKQLDDRVVYELTLSNSGENLAFMLGLSLLGEDSGKEVLPSLWSENYLNLLPGETRKVYVEIDRADLHEEAIIECKGFNAKATIINIRH